MESKYEMQKPDKVRFTLFIVFHIVLCIFVFFYAKSLVEFAPIVDTVSDFYVDGTDFTGIINAVNYFYNGIFIVITGVFYIIAMFVWSAVLLIPLRIIGLRKSIQVTGFEVKTTLAVTVAGVILTFAAGALFMGMESLWVMGVMFLPVLILEITIYWIGLWERRQSRAAHME